MSDKGAAEGGSAGATGYACAAGPWQEGAPAEFGRYLIEYRHEHVWRVFIGDYDPVEKRWLSTPDDWECIRWAEINSPHA